MPDLDMMGGGMPQKPDNHEAAMARADLYKCANYSFKLFKMIQDGQELEGWVQAKITKAADYIASVYHYMEYEMKFNEYGQKLENADIYTEDVKKQFIQKLTEARVKLEKLKEKNIADLDEGWDDMIAAGKKRAAEKGTGKFDSKKTSTGTVYTRKASTYDDGGKDADQKKAEKKAKKANEGLGDVAKKVGGVLKKAGSKALDKLGHGSDEDMIKDLQKKVGVPQTGKKPMATRNESLKGGQKKLDVDKDGKLEKSDFAKLRASKGVKEGAKPDFLDMDKDGDKKEPMKKAVSDKKKTEGIVAEKAVSKAQQKFMGMVHAAKKGEKPASAEVAKAAKGMSAKAAKDFASTKHKGLPAKKVDESYPKNQDLSRISTEKLKAYADKQAKQAVSGEGAQLKRVKAELAKRNA